MAYKSVSEIPQVPDMVVQTDARHNAVLLPIYGVLVPFHISTIKGVDSNSAGEGEATIIRITFHAPGMASAANYEPALKVAQSRPSPRHLLMFVPPNPTLPSQIPIRNCMVSEHLLLFPTPIRTEPHH